MRSKEAPCRSRQDGNCVRRWKKVDVCEEHVVGLGVLQRQIPQSVDRVEVALLVHHVEANIAP